MMNKNKNNNKNNKNNKNKNKNKNREKKKEEKTTKYRPLRWELKHKYQGYEVKQYNIIVAYYGGGAET